MKPTLRWNIFAPQSPRSGWESDIYLESTTIHTLGNLILLPRKENNVVGGRSWKHKKLMYKLLSSETQDEFNVIQDKLQLAGLTLSKTAEVVLRNSKYLGMCKSVGAYADPWSVEIIKKRTERFAELAWKRLEPWLYS